VISCIMHLENHGGEKLLRLCSTLVLLNVKEAEEATWMGTLHKFKTSFENKYWVLILDQSNGNFLCTKMEKR
jgi:hypothetical protein